MNTLPLHSRFAFVILLGTFILTSCTDSGGPSATQTNDETGTTIDIAGILMAADREPYGFLSTTADHNPIDGMQSTYTIHGAISTMLKYQNRVDGGTMTVGGIDVESDPTYSFVYWDAIRFTLLPNQLPVRKLLIKRCLTAKDG